MKVIKVSGTFNDKGVLIDKEFNPAHRTVAIVDYAELLEFIRSTGLVVETRKKVRIE